MINPGGHARVSRDETSLRWQPTNTSLFANMATFGFVVGRCILVVALWLLLVAADGSVEDVDESMRRALQARFRDMLDAEQTRYDEKVRSLESEIHELESQIKEEKKRRLATAKSNKWLTKKVPKLLNKVNALLTKTASRAMLSDVSTVETRMATVETDVMTLETNVRGLRVDLDDAGLSIQPFTSRDDLGVAVKAYIQGSWDGFIGDVFYGHSISYFDVSRIEDFSGLFAVQPTFNEPLNDWQTFSATNMYRMFSGANSFNQPLGSWSVGKVTSMRDMFFNARSFNDMTLDQWDVSSCENMYRTFGYAKAFQGPLGSWNVEKVTTMLYMFGEAKAFNDDSIANWTPTKASSMRSMFQGTSSFNVDISGWNVSSLETVATMFGDTKAFSQNLCDWGTVLGVDTNVEDMFLDAEACASQDDPNLAASPPGPFCAVCTST